MMITCEGELQLGVPEMPASGFGDFGDEPACYLFRQVLRTGTAQHYFRRANQDFQIHPEIPVLDVRDIERHILIE